MFKHRDNIAHAPGTVDPFGAGMASSGTAQPTSAGRKRGRDIRGLDKFRTVVYGEQGFSRLHAMVTRNPVLMYPPQGISAARMRVEENLRRDAERTEQEKQQKEDEALWAMFDERRRAEDAAVNDTNAQEEANSASMTTSTQDVELANYHHKQLDSFVKLVYEFHHTVFVKIPMNDTLQLLSRCGKESVAHVVEFEMHQRMARETKLRQLRALRQERLGLQQRQEKTEEAVETARLEEAEAMQTVLETMDEAAWLAALQQSEEGWEGEDASPDPAAAVVADEAEADVEVEVVVANPEEVTTE